MKTHEINIAELDDANRADVREWALNEFAPLRSGTHLSSIRLFLAATPSPTALVAGMWEQWSKGWTPKRGAEAKLEQDEFIEPGLYEVEPLDFGAVTQ